MIVGTITKQPGEQFPVSIDFSDRIPDGDAIASATVTAIKKSDGSDATATILTGSVGIVGGVVTRECKAGSAATDYIITFVATLTLVVGRNLEDELLLLVRAQP